MPLLVKVEDGNDVRMGAKPAHCLGLRGDAGPGHIVQALSLDQSESNFSVEEGVED